MRDVTYRSTARHEPIRRARSAFYVCAGVGALLATPSVAEEAPPEIIAAHIRMQGFACENALSAERDGKVSKPNETVWTLRCSNGTYRVRLVPDMAASVEPLK
jgi:hypothetical protein